MPEDNKYKCIECANMRTPLCDLCNFTEHPLGEQGKPTYYINANIGVQNNRNAWDMAILIASRLNAGKPIYLNWVMHYNQIANQGGDNDVEA